MGKYATLQINETVEKLNDLIKGRYRNTKYVSRLDALKAIKKEEFRTRAQLCTHMGIGKRTLERWVNKYKAGGVDYMCCDKLGKKGSKWITAPMHEDLSKMVHDTSAPLLGYRHAQDWINEKYDVQVKYQTIRKYLIKHFHTKLKTPGKSHVQKGEQAAEAFLKTA